MKLIDKQLPFTPRAKNNINIMFEEASRYNQIKIGTEFLLLAILTDDEGIAASVLKRDFGITLLKYRMFLNQSLGEINARNVFIPLEMYVDPGSASVEDISELLLEISTLYRMLGGSGINFTIVEAREPQFEMM